MAAGQRHSSSARCAGAGARDAADGGGPETGGAVTPASGAPAARAELAPPSDGKVAQLSNRPSRVLSVVPRTRVRPPEPTTSAHTIRGDTPRWTTWMPRKLPFTRLPSRACT